jgi:DNA repair exonuclease SbcCD nuclease subunit
MALKILHTADIHIGMSFASRGYRDDLRKQLVEARFEIMERIIQSANDNKCDMVVVAGDLFDRPNVKKTDIAKTARILKQFNGKCIAVLPGNHDFYDPAGELWRNFRENAPDNSLLLSEPKPYSLDEFGMDIDAVLYPAPCSDRNSLDCNTSWINHLDERPRSKWQIGIAHGSLNGVCPDMNGRYYRMDEKTLKGLGLDLWLLGHSHVRYPDKDGFGDYRIIYCGTPEPDGFDCSHPGYFWIITLEDDGRIIGQSLSCAKFHFREIAMRVSTGEDLEALRDSITSSSTENLLLRLSITGQLSKENMDLWDRVYNQIARVVAYADRASSDLTLEITKEIIDEEFTRGSLPHRVLTDLAESGDKQALQIAYELMEEVRPRK